MFITFLGHYSVCFLITLGPLVLDPSIYLCTLSSLQPRDTASLRSATAPRMPAAMACARLTPLASPTQCDRRVTDTLWKLVV